MEIISALVIGYCTKKLYGIYKNSQKNRRVTVKQVHDTEQTRVESLRSRIRKNQRWALDHMGGEYSSDPMAKYYAEERKEMIRPGAENNPEVIAIRKMIQEKRQQSVEARWNYTV